jgi:hypothetical protein
MPKNMGRTPAPARDTCPAHRLSNDGRDGTMGSEGAKRRARADKQYICVGLRPTVLQVAHYRMANLLGQRQPSLATSFSRYLNMGFFPIDITQTKLNDISGPKSQAGQEKENRTIPPAHP